MLSGADKRTLIPIKYRDCVIPDLLRHVAMLDYTREDTKPWFWQRLASSIRTVSPDNNYLYPFVLDTGHPLPAPVSSTSDYTNESFSYLPVDQLAPATVSEPLTSQPTETEMEMMSAPQSQFLEVQSTEMKELDQKELLPKRRLGSRRHSSPNHPSIKLTSFLKSKNK